MQPIKRVLILLLVAALLIGGCAAKPEPTEPSETEPAPSIDACEDCGMELSECPRCDGSGRCSNEYHDAAGNHPCGYCISDQGPVCTYCTDGTCTECEDGYAHPIEECNFCRGSGDCSSCEGSGYYLIGDYLRACSWCYKPGRCRYCDGKGERRISDNRCYSCRGNQKCRYCGGDRSRCTENHTPCPTGGKCPLCIGERKICKPCNGIGSPSSGNNHSSSTNTGYDYDYDSDESRCWNCGGSGTDDCDECFNGDCVECAGEGENPVYASGDIKYVDCAYCTGGRCRSCGGNGYVNCPDC